MRRVVARKWFGRSVSAFRRSGFFFGGGGGVLPCQHCQRRFCRLSVAIVNQALPRPARRTSYQTNGVAMGTVPPLEVQLLGADEPLSAGKEVTVTCLVRGSRPPPVLIWFLGDSLIKEMAAIVVSFLLPLLLFFFSFFFFFLPIFLSISVAAQLAERRVFLFVFFWGGGIPRVRSDLKRFSVV